MHSDLLLPVGALSALVIKVLPLSLSAGPAVCELLSVGICLLPVCASLLQQVHHPKRASLPLQNGNKECTVCVQVSHISGEDCGKVSH